jgi:hypothetical protein
MDLRDPAYECQTDELSFRWVVNGCSARVVPDLLGGRREAW